MNGKQALVSLSSLLFLLASDAKSQSKIELKKESNPLKLEEVLTTTLTRHPLLQAVESEREYAEADVLSAEGAFDRAIKGETSSHLTGYYSGSYFNSNVEQPLKDMGARLFAGYRRGGGTFPIYDNYYNTNDGGEIRAGIEAPLLRDRETDKQRTSLGKAKIQREIAKATISARRIELLRAASFAYWEWVASGSKYHIYDALYDVATARQKQFDERFRAGDIPRFELVDNIRLTLQRESQAIAAERSLQKSEFELSLFLRDDEGKQESVHRNRLPKQLPLPTLNIIHDVEIQIAEAVKTRPELKRLASQLDQNDLDLKLSKNQILPKLDALIMASKDTGEQNTAGKDNLDPAEIKSGLKFEIPLQTRTQTGRIAFHESKSRELKRLEQFTLDRISVDVRDSLNAISVASKRVVIAKDEVKTAKEVEKGERIRFDNGDSNLIFINLREQTSADAEVRLVDALLDYHRSVASFEAAVASGS